jgi:pyruvate kinase
LPRTKLVCTLGPATDPPEVLDAMIQAGMSVARINFSHGAHPDHTRRIAQVRDASARAGATVAVLADLQGPKFRIGDIEGGSVRIEPGGTIVLTTRPGRGDARSVHLPHPELVAAVRPGQRVLLDDGSIELEVETATGTELRCRVVAGSTLASRKGVSVPDTTLAVPSLTEKDREDAKFAVSHDVDMLALSFVRAAADVQVLHTLLGELHADTMVVSKIEKRQALDAFPAILAASDAVMVARGDLGVETPAEEVPIHQKEIIRACNHAGTPVITATQMLQSMVESPTPTRAEASDVANAILDGSDAVMLSAETAIGKHPVEAVRVMARIAERTEPHLASRPTSGGADAATDPTDAIAQAAVDTAAGVGAAAIVSATLGGYAPQRIAKYRPHTPVLAVTPDPRVQQRLALTWGVVSRRIAPARSAEEMLQMALAAVREAGVARPGDTIVLTGGIPVVARGRTNFLKLHVVE